MVRRICLLFSILLFLAGSVSLANLRFLGRIQRDFYARTEPYFSAPVLAPDSTLYVRKDRYGKGIYGSSRNGGRRHAGIDLISAKGDPIYAAKSGRVVRAAREPGYGLHIYLLHPDGFVTRYAHLESIRVYPGQWVPVGQIIGTCGKTGNAANPGIMPHLHFEIRKQDRTLDPTVGRFDPHLKIVQ